MIRENAPESEVLESARASVEVGDKSNTQSREQTGSHQLNVAGEISGQWNARVTSESLVSPADMHGERDLEQNEQESTFSPEPRQQHSSAHNDMET